MGLEKPVNRGFRDKVAPGVRKPDGQFPGRQLRLLQGKIDDLPPDIIGNVTLDIPDTRGRIMDDSVEVLKSWFSVFYQFDGLIIVLKAFFDETGGDETKDLTAVAGFVYDEAGLTEFTEAWAPHITGLSKPYRTSTCNAGYDPFNQPDWPHDRRQFLMDKLATLSVDHSLAGFVTATTKRDYEEACENGPGIGGFIDSPYTCQRRSKISPPGRSKTSPLNVMRYAVLGGCPGSP